jgi:predicted outer membrane repeat protein
MKTSTSIRGLFVIGTLLSSYATHAATHYVSLNSKTPTSPYTSWKTASQNIQSAIDVSMKGDIIEIDSGTYSLSSEIVLKGGITVKATAAANVTIDGQDSVRCFEWTPSSPSGSTVVLEDLTIMNGNSSTSDGGGVYCNSNGVITIENCTFQNNEAHGYGGGVYGENASAVWCTFKNNVATKGGGMAEGTANGCWFSGNHSSASGGAIRNVVADSCVITENSAYSGRGSSGGNLRN